MQLLMHMWVHITCSCTCLEIAHFNNTFEGCWAYVDRTGPFRSLNLSSEMKHADKIGLNNSFLFNSQTIHSGLLEEEIKSVLRSFELWESRETAYRSYNYCSVGSFGEKYCSLQAHWVAALAYQNDSSYWCARVYVWTTDDRKEILLRTWTSGFPYCLYFPTQFRALGIVFLRISELQGEFWWEKFSPVCWCDPDGHPGNYVVHGSWLQIWGKVYLQD